MLQQKEPTILTQWLPGTDSQEDQEGFLVIWPASWFPVLRFWVEACLQSSPSCL